MIYIYNFLLINIIIIIIIIYRIYASALYHDITHICNDNKVLLNLLLIANQKTNNTWNSIQRSSSE